MGIITTSALYISSKNELLNTFNENTIEVVAETKHADSQFSEWLEMLTPNEYRVTPNLVMLLSLVEIYTRCAKYNIFGIYKYDPICVKSDKNRTIKVFIENFSDINHQVACKRDILLTIIKNLINETDKNAYDAEGMQGAKNHIEELIVLMQEFQSISIEINKFLEKDCANNVYPYMSLLKWVKNS